MVFRILCGLVDRNDGSNFMAKLYRIKGKRAPITTEMVALDWSNFNSRDVYLIHTENVIFIWVGRAASATEKLHAIKVCQWGRDQSKFDISALPVKITHFCKTVKII